jgi:uncharacterized protein
LTVHVEDLIANKHMLLAAGAQVADDGQGRYGGIMIVDIDHRKEAEAFIQNDPFTKARLFAGIEVVRWRKAFFNMERLIQAKPTRLGASQASTSQQPYGRLMALWILGQRRRLWSSRVRQEGAQTRMRRGQLTHARGSWSER